MEAGGIGKVDGCIPDGGSSCNEVAYSFGSEGTLAAVTHAIDDGDGFIQAAVPAAKSSMHHPCISRAVDRLFPYASRALLR